MFVQFTFELIALSAKADVRVDAQVSLQMALQIIFVHKFGITDVA
jgi:hypothetical protein